MSLLDIIKDNARKQPKRIVLPEGEEERTLRAANEVLKTGIAEIILIGNPKVIKDAALSHDLNDLVKATIVDPQNIEKREQYADLMVELGVIKE